MLESIIMFYKTELNPIKLVFNEIRTWWYLFVMSAVSSILTSLIFALNEKPHFYIFPFVFLLVVMFLILNHKAKRVLKQKFNIKSENYMWFGPAYNEMRVKKLKAFLEEKKLLDKDKVKLLIDLLYKEAENSKFSGLISKGLFLAMFVPIWSNFMGWVYKQLGTFNEALATTLTLTFVIIWGLITVEMVKGMVADLFDRKSQKLKSLAGLMEEVLLSI